MQAKKELAKKEGRLLTPKQKAEKAAAEARLQALLASGVKVEGLQSGAGAAKPKKVVYSNKKKGPAAKKQEAADPKVDEVAEKLEKVEIKKDESEDDWDKSEEDVPPPPPAAAAAGSDDDWDKSSEDEEEKPAARTFWPSLRVLSAL